MKYEHDDNKKMYLTLSINNKESPARNRKAIIAGIMILCLIGCTGQTRTSLEHNEHVSPDISSRGENRYEHSSGRQEYLSGAIESHLTQCNRDLESLRTVSMTEYRRYLAEYDGLMKNAADFMTVKDDVSPEVAELARPKFQFALVNLCYRIKDALAQTLINQAGGR